MGTSKGNGKYISVEKMGQLFKEYKKEVKDNPRIVTEFHGKDGDARSKPLERPLTLSGFEVYVYNQGLNAGVSHYFMNYEDRYSDYVSICTRIRKEIRRDQIEGGMVGQYNSSITQRLNGLVDKQQMDVKTEPRVFNIDSNGKETKGIEGGENQIENKE